MLHNVYRLILERRKRESKDIHCVDIMFSLHVEFERK